MCSSGENQIALSQKDARSRPTGQDDTCRSTHDLGEIGFRDREGTLQSEGNLSQFEELDYADRPDPRRERKWRVRRRARLGAKAQEWAPVGGRASLLIGHRHHPRRRGGTLTKFKCSRQEVGSHRIRAKLPIDGTGAWQSTFIRGSCKPIPSRKWSPPGLRFLSARMFFDHPPPQIVVIPKFG